MNKMMTVGFAALMVAGIAGAQDDMVMTGMPQGSADQGPEVTAEAALLSSYVWRGQVYNNDAVLQPQITISKSDFSFNIWGNYNLAGADRAGISSDFSEIDLSVAYDLPVNISDMAVSVGAIHYTFPANASFGVPGVGANAQATTELFVSGTINTWADLVVPVIPSVTIYGDIDEATGIYALFDVNVPYEVSDYLSVNGGISAGYGSNTYNDYYFGALAQDAGWNDCNIYAGAEYEVADNVTVSANLTYTFLEGGSIKDAASMWYDDNQKFWGGFNVAYQF